MVQKDLVEAKLSELARRIERVAAHRTESAIPSSLFARPRKGSMTCVRSRAMWVCSFAVRADLSETGTRYA